MEAEAEIGASNDTRWKKQPPEMLPVSPRNADRESAVTVTPILLNAKVKVSAQ
jgi:hypothetical protein